LAAGNYAGAITVAVSGATNSPVTVGVTLAVSPATTPSLSAAPPSLSFTIQQGAAAQTAQVAVSTSSGNIAFQAATSGAGFSVSPGSGTTPGSVTVTANPAGLSVGAHTGSLSVTAAGTSNSPLAVPLTLTVTAAPTQPISITSGNPSGGTVGVPYSFAFTASGGNGTYSWSVLTGSLPAGLSLSPSGALTGTPTSAGTSSFTVQVADTGGGAPATASVSVTINPAASIQLNLTNQSLSLSAQVNGSASSQSVGYSLSNGSSATISATPFTQSGGGWLAVQLSSGSTPGTATITANPSGLSAGTYGGSVTFTANPPSGPVSASVSVSFTVTGGQQTSALSVSPPSVSIAAAVGAAARTATLNVTSSGSPLIFNATASGGNWLAVSPSGSTTPANLTVTATPGNLAAGTYNGSITIASQDASNSPVTVNVTLTLSAGPATLTANPAQVAFNIALGSGPASQTVALGSTGAPISFSASSIVSQWLSVSPSSGTTPATLTVTVNPATLGLGVHSGAIVVSAPGATNPSLSLNVQVTVATQARPVISQIQQGGSFAPVIAPNTWIVIKGSNLAGTTRVNRPDEIVNGSYPTSMDGVRVSVNGRPAFLYYISPTQLNVAAPDDPAVGSVPVTVTVGAQTSEVATAQMQQFAPGFFLWPGNQVVATSADNFQWRVRPGTFEGAQTVSAQPGEVVVLWGTGFGPTNPPTPAGQVVVNAGFVVNAVRVTVGGTEAEYFGAAMTPDFTALCQVAIRIPANAPDGDLPVVVTMGGISSPTNAVISVRRR
ncbi:MAG: BACON domain-containing protein, partial [Bryobacteraceae bacterium]